MNHTIGYGAYCGAIVSTVLTLVQAIFLHILFARRNYKVCTYQILETNSEERSMPYDFGECYLYAGGQLSTGSSL